MWKEFSSGKNFRFYSDFIYEYLRGLDFDRIKNVIPLSRTRATTGVSTHHEALVVLYHN